MTTKSTFRVLFLTQKGKPRPDGRVPVVARITINKQMAHLTTSVDVNPDHWLPKEGRTTGVSRDDKEANSTLEDYRVVIRQKFNELMMNGEVVTAARVKMAVTSLDEKSYNLLEICQEFIDDYYKLVLTGSVTSCTYQRYVLTRERLKEFIKVKYRASDFPISQVNHSFIKGFYLHKLIADTADLGNTDEYPPANADVVDVAEVVPPFERAVVDTEKCRRLFL